MHYWRDERYRIHAVLARGKTVASVPLCCSKGFFYKSYNHQLQSFFIISSSPSPTDYTTSENCRSCWRWHLLVDSNSTSYVLVKWITLIVVQLHFSHLGDAFITSDGVVRPRARGQQVAVTLARALVLGYGSLMTCWCNKSWQCPPGMVLCSLCLSPAHRNTVHQYIM